MKIIMTPDNIHAFGMILMAAITLGICMIFGRNPLNGGRIKDKIKSAIGVGLVGLIVLNAVLAQGCIEAPNEGYQGTLPPLCMMCLIIFIDRKKVIVLTSIVLVFLGVTLKVNFNHIVRVADGYTAIDINTNKPIAKGCSDRNSAEGIIAAPLWHTCFTGIYEIKK
ncbi:MAG TPA: hypothetical protein VN642_08750 [Dongiaceae bacterium]|nr:hypothetical protein [Dongiaceae bacterium]